MTLLYWQTCEAAPVKLVHQQPRRVVLRPCNRAAAIIRCWNAFRGLKAAALPFFPSPGDRVQTLEPLRSEALYRDDWHSRVRPGRQNILTRNSCYKELHLILAWLLHVKRLSGNYENELQLLNSSDLPSSSLSIVWWPRVKTCVRPQTCAGPTVTVLMEGILHEWRLLDD